MKTYCGSKGTAPHIAIDSRQRVHFLLENVLKEYLRKTFLNLKVLYL